MCDAAQTPGRPITRAEALSISHATLENAESERNASDDAAVSLEDDNASLAELLTARENQVDDLSEALSAKEEIIAIYAQCIREAGCLWHEAHPDSELYPDDAELVVWLKEQVDALAGRRCETCRFCERLDGKWCCVAMSHELSFYVEPQSDFCSTWQSKEDADD